MTTRYDAAELAAAGRDVESQVLSRAVRWHSETRVLLNGPRPSSSADQPLLTGDDGYFPE